MKLDKIDQQILSLLQKDAQRPFTEIAEQVCVSPGTVHVRMRKLKEAGIVTGSTLKINYATLGFDIKAFLGIYLEKSGLYDDVVGQLREIPEILSIDYTTGDYSIFVKIICRDTNHLREVLHDKIQQVKGIDRTETIISLEETLDREINLR